MMTCVNCGRSNGWWRRRCTICGHLIRVERAKVDRVNQRNAYAGGDIVGRDKRTEDEDFSALALGVGLSMMANNPAAPAVTAPVIEPGGGTFGGAGASAGWDTPSPSSYDSSPSSYDSGSSSSGGGDSGSSSSGGGDGGGGGGGSD